MLARLERRHHLVGVQLQRGVDVDDVDVRVGEHRIVVGVADVDPELVADFVELGLGALADRVHLGVGVALVDGDELGTEFEPDDTDAEDAV